MTIETLIEKLNAIEAADDLEYTEYLTDGDEEDYHPTVKAALEVIEELLWLDAAQCKRIKDAGFDIIRGDCIGIDTRKGVIHTGCDNM